MKLYLLLIFLFTTFTEAQLDTSKIEEARRFLYSQDTRHYPFFFDKGIKKASIEQGLHFYVFNYAIDSPLKNTDFLLFHSIRRDPNPYYLITSYRDTFHLVYDSWCRDSYGCNSLVEFINERLLDEEVLQTQQVTELAATLGKLSFPNNKIVSNSDEVWFRDYRNIVVHLPDSLKGLVKPLLIETTSDSTVLEFFVWNYLVLEKVTLIYRKKQIEINSKMIWKSGHQFTSG